jgi:hypothetical protein
VLLYAECRSPDPTKQLAEPKAGSAHDKDAPPCALGTRARATGARRRRISRRASRSTMPTRRVAGELFAELGRTDEANAHSPPRSGLALAELAGN